MLPQPRVRDGRRELLLDDLLGATWRLVLVSDDDAVRAGCAALAAAQRLPLIIVGEGARPPAGARQVQEADDLLRDWLAAAGLIGALVRPDHYVYGGFATLAEARALLQQRAAQLPLPPRADHDRSHHEGDTPHDTASRP